MPDPSSQTNAAPRQWGGTVSTYAFQDNTSLNFDFATSFATEAFFSRWKAGNERVLRYWPRIHPEPVF